MYFNSIIYTSLSDRQFMRVQNYLQLTSDVIKYLLTLDDSRGLLSSVGSVLSVFLSVHRFAFITQKL